MIADQAIVTYVGNWPGPPILNGNYTTDVFADLAGAGLIVRGFTGGPGVASALFETSFNITLNLQVENGVGFLSPDDVISIIRSFVQKRSGNFPLSDSIPYVQANATATPVSTGQPGATTGAGAGTAPGSGAHACGDPSWGFFDDPGQYLSCLSTKGLSTIGIIFIGVLVGVAFILFSQHEVRRV